MQPEDVSTNNLHLQVEKIMNLVKFQRINYDVDYVVIEPIPKKYKDYVRNTAIQKIPDFINIFNNYQTHTILPGNKLNHASTNYKAVLNDGFKLSVSAEATLRHCLLFGAGVYFSEGSAPDIDNSVILSVEPKRKLTLLKVNYNDKIFEKMFRSDILSECGVREVISSAVLLFKNYDGIYIDQASSDVPNHVLIFLPNETLTHPVLASKNIQDVKVQKMDLNKLLNTKTYAYENMSIVENNAIFSMKSKIIDVVKGGDITTTDVSLIEYRPNDTQTNSIDRAFEEAKNGRNVYLTVFGDFRYAGGGFSRIKDDGSMPKTQEEQVFIRTNLCKIYNDNDKIIHRDDHQEIERCRQYMNTLGYTFNKERDFFFSVEMMKRLLNGDVFLINDVYLIRDSYGKLLINADKPINIIYVAAPMYQKKMAFNKPNGVVDNTRLQPDHIHTFNINRKIQIYNRIIKNIFNAKLETTNNVLMFGALGFGVYLENKQHPFMGLTDAKLIDMIKNTYIDIILSNIYKTTFDKIYNIVPSGIINLYKRPLSSAMVDGNLELSSTNTFLIVNTKIGRINIIFNRTGFSNTELNNIKNNISGKIFMLELLSGNPPYFTYNDSNQLYNFIRSSVNKGMLPKHVQPNTLTIYNTHGTNVPQYVFIYFN